LRKTMGAVAATDEYDISNMEADCFVLTERILSMLQVA
jgi:hypothetical protein